MNPYQIVSEELIQLQVEQGSACPTFKNSLGTFQIFPGSVQMNAPLRAGGFSAVYDLQFTAIVSQMITQAIPNVTALKNALLNTFFTYLGDDFKIKEAHILTGGTMIKIGANSKNENA